MEAMETSNCEYIDGVSRELREIKCSILQLEPTVLNENQLLNRVINCRQFQNPWNSFEHKRGISLFLVGPITSSTWTLIGQPNFFVSTYVALLNNFYYYHLMILPVVRVLLRAFTLNRRSTWSRALLPATSKYRVEFGKVQKNCYGIRNSYELTYEELKALYDADDVLIIDVRDPEEIKKQGKIEGSYNIPLGQLSEALKLTPEAFRKQYHFEKPTKYDANIVFHGLSHIKSTAALEIAHKYGYKKSRHYPAGWEEWSKKFTNEQ
ncbi:Thiosulfate sulfurtransferase/rhodanese-like domain-containing protein 3 [Trichinella papuae]|uniref:Thiosulfate sulfurtransferase/rhodanese-like domain-containing protein 3 n=1 Tax=Trichinella papuae TaxID=268474 RepID=A0A0V1N353_9BILA|nr:Thiosulfate sulfurtransferase/rhodanese-like domain-containing protein 3 [Trichinella papuae]